MKDFKEQTAISEAQVSLDVAQATIEVKPDTKTGEVVQAYIPDWFLLLCIVIGALFLLAGAIRFTPFGKWWRLFWKTWRGVAGGEPNE